MQNFTLGKKGISMLFLAFFLLIGNSLTFGQVTNCPTVSNTNPDAFCYLDDIAKLTMESGAVAGNDGLRWYRTADSTNPIPNDEFLENGFYYAGNNSGTCANRIAVEVTVTNIGAPTTDFGNFFQPCEYAADDTSTVQDLIDNVTATNTSYTIEVFDEEYGTSALDPATLLISGDNTSYFIGQRDPNASPNCPSSRIAVSYDPVLAEAPTGDTVQTFCAGATVADLEATFTSPNGTAIRWYSTEDSQPRLSAATPLINGEFYYASQIVNRQNSILPPCESTMRFSVEVVLEVVQVNESDQSFCVDSEDASTTPTVEDLISPFGNPFFADAEFTQLLSPSTTLVDGEDYFTASGDENNCQVERVIVEFVEIPNAGADVNETFCSTELDNPNALIAEFTALLVGRDLNGTFTDSDLTQLAAQYEISPIGTFTTTYTVTNGDCEDSAIFTVTVQEATPADAGTIEDFELCQSEETTNLYTLLGLDPNERGIFTDENDDVIVDGNFTPSAIGPFPITYTVDEENEGTACIEGSDFEDFTITVNAAAPAIVEEIEDEFICINENIIELNSLLVGETTPGGIFTGVGVSLNNNQEPVFDPSIGAGTYAITYKVDGNEMDCITGEASTTFNITVTPIEQANAGRNTIWEFCINQNEDIILLSLIDPTANRFGSFSAPFEDGIISVSEQTVGFAEITYTVSGEDDCSIGEDEAIISITIRPIENANAGGDQTPPPYCVEDNQNIDLRDLLGLGASRFGSFLLNGEEINSFNPAEKGVGEFTITYNVDGAEDCAIGEDTATIILTVSPVAAANAGGDQTPPPFCVEDDQNVDLLSLLGVGANTFGTFELDGEDITTFNPAEQGEGEFEITYRIDGENNCAEGTDSAKITITVSPVTPANAGGSQTPPAYCVTDNLDIELVTLLGAGANTFGTFELDGEDITTFNPAEQGEGEFEITYRIDGENNCAEGTDSATITITVNAVPEAPVADAEQSFCLVDNNTVADLVASGDNIVWYEDEDLTTVASATTPLENGAVYYAVATGDNTCGSPSTMVTVTMNDPDAPTLQLEGNEFCRSDNPTLQDLLDNINGSGIQVYASLTGGTALASTTALQDDVEYFATSTDATLGCESSERLAIRVEVAFCGIPEGFSPNGDDKNESFVIPDIAIDFPNYNIEIYNRWGNMVFKGNASTDDWNGISNQSGTLGDGVMPVGVYFYILNYNDGATTPIQGKLYLSR